MIELLILLLGCTVAFFVLILADAARGRVGRNPLANYPPPRIPAPPQPPKPS